MKPVTTGRGISGIFADELDTLVGEFRTESDPRWRLYVYALRSPEYCVRVYAPDLHSELHTVPETPDTVEDIRAILLNEAASWLSRVRADADSQRLSSLLVQVSN